MEPDSDEEEIYPEPSAKRQALDSNAGQQMDSSRPRRQHSALSSGSERNSIFHAPLGFDDDSSSQSPSEGSSAWTPSDEEEASPMTQPGLEEHGARMTLVVCSYD